MCLILNVSAVEASKVKTFKIISDNYNLEMFTKQN